MQLQQWVVEIEMGNHKAPWEPPRNPQLILGAGQDAFWETKLIAEGWVKSARSWVVGGVGKYSRGNSTCKGPEVREWLACLGNTKGGIFLSCSLQYHQCLEQWLSHSMSINIYWMHEKAELRPTAFAFCDLLSAWIWTFRRELKFSQKSFCLVFIFVSQGREYSLFHLLMNS